MKVIFKYLKPFVAVIFVSLLLLFGQAMCDLSLPNLMSDIVNVGIQRSGVDEAAPQVISQEGFALIRLFLSDSDQSVLQEHYTLEQPGSDLAKQQQSFAPKAAEQPIYVLTATEPEDLAQVETAYSRAAYAFMTFMKTQLEGQGITEKADSETGYADLDINQVYQALPALQMMPRDLFNDAIQAAQNADLSLSSQVSVTFTRLFYEELGVDLGGMQMQYILKTGGSMLLLALAGVAAAVAVGFLASRVGAAVSRNLRHDVFEKVEGFTSAEFDQFSTASLITRTTNDVQQVQMLITMGLRLMLYAPIMGIGGVIMAVNKSMSLSWIIAVAVVVLLGLILVAFSIALPKFKSLQKLVDRLNLVSRESLSGMMVIRAFGNEQHEAERFEKANRDLCDTNRFVQRTMAVMMPSMMLLMNLLTLTIVWVGSKAIADSTLQIGDMMAFMQYAMQIIMAFLMIAMMFIMVPRAAVSAVRIQEVLQTQPTIVDPKQPKTLGKNPQGVLEFNDVSFRYDQAEKDVLEHISFVSKPGQTTAFIGSTGSGKSTLVSLIPRFYDVTQGSITIDGVDIRDLPQKELRDVIGYVPQKGVLFSGDIASNVRFGKTDATDQEVDEAVRIAQAEEFVHGSEHGIHTEIAQGGDNVSGGQKQRLSIARALAKQAPIYIFDDSFSALDFKTDAALRAALAKDTANANVLIVAQRVSTIMHADQILVLDHGKIVGKGTHQELLKHCAPYLEIVQSQLAKEELA